jgi:type II restriction enzyme
LRKLIQAQQILSDIGMPKAQQNEISAFTFHDKLPDIILLDTTKRWLFLIEAVTSHGPMNPKRVFELQKMFNGSKCGLVFVSTFLDFAEFKQHSKDISWETEVWIAAFPDHMIHFNGDKFMGPR